MNEFKLNKIEKENYNKLDTSFRKDLNIIKFHKSNTEFHELAKAKICYWLLKNDKKFCTEARLTNGSRPDIFNLTDGVAIEVIHSEIQKSIDLKKTKYGIYILAVDAMEILGTEFEDLCNILN